MQSGTAETSALLFEMPTTPTVRIQCTGRLCVLRSNLAGLKM